MINTRKAKISNTRDSFTFFFAHSYCSFLSIDFPIIE